MAVVIRVEDKRKRACAGIRAANQTVGPKTFLAEEIQNSVEQKFSITLTIEPIIVGYQKRKSRL